MNALLEYMLKSGLYLAVFFLVYKFLLSGETFFRANRLFLVAGLVVALLLPLISIHYAVNVPGPNLADQGDAKFSLQIVSPSGHTSILDKIWLPTIVSIYCLGVVFLIAKCLIQILEMCGQIKTGTKAQANGIILVDSQKYNTPFSFFDYVIINRSNYSQKELSSIIAHEKVHIQERHWIDLLLAWLATTLFWLNPVIWWYEKTIKLNHEYLADDGVIRQGFSPSYYAAFLVNQIVGTPIIPLTNSLNFKLKKDRITMMSKSKSSGAKRWRILFIMPFVGIILMAFASPKYVNDNTSGKSEHFAVSQEQLKIIEGKIYNTSTEAPIPGANIIIKGTTEGTVSDNQGNFKLKSSKGSTMVISFVGYQTKEVEINETARYDVPMDLKVYEITFPEKIETRKDQPKQKMKRKTGVALNSKEIFTVVEDMPKYQDGGMNGLESYIHNKTSAYVQKTGLKGEVHVEFKVDENGNISNSKIVKSSNNKLDPDALKIVNEMGAWKPGKQRGKPITVQMVVPVKFE